MRDILDDFKQAVLGRRASFKRRVKRMLEVVMAEAETSVDDAADQVMVVLHLAWILAMFSLMSVL